MAYTTARLKAKWGGLWGAHIDQAIRTKLQVFRAVGPDLQAAMIAAEVISIQRMQDNEDAPISKFNELYMAACQKHIPDYYTQESKDKL